MAASSHFRGILLGVAHDNMKKVVLIDIKRYLYKPPNTHRHWVTPQKRAGSIIWPGIDGWNFLEKACSTRK